jgi:hypothetical protein
LPRLYGWFHVTLSVADGAAFVLARALRVARPGACRAAASARVGCVGALFELRNSQVMRYAAHERTALAALVLRGVPMACRRAPVAAAARQAAEVALPPLPDGPRRPDADVLLITDRRAPRRSRRRLRLSARATTPNIDALAARGTRFTPPTRRRRTRRSRSRRC